MGKKHFEDKNFSKINQEPFKKQNSSGKTYSLKQLQTVSMVEFYNSYHNSMMTQNLNYSLGVPCMPQNNVISHQPPLSKFYTNQMNAQNLNASPGQSVQCISTNGNSRHNSKRSSKDSCFVEVSEDSYSPHYLSNQASTYFSNFSNYNSNFGSNNSNSKINNSPKIQINSKDSREGLKLNNINNW
jgi:hypothetical protein